MRLGVTRAHGRINNLVKPAASRGIEIVPLPLVETQPVAFDWPENLPVERVDWVFFTSANGVVSFFRRLDELGLALSPKTMIAAVGGKTAEAVGQLGLDVSFTPSQSGGEALFAEFLNATEGISLVLIYARGRVVQFDPSELMGNRNTVYHPVVCYESVSCRVDPEIVARFTAGDYILFTAPSAVAAFHEQFGPPGAKVIGIGQTTAAAMARLGWTEITTMKQPAIDRVLEYL